MFGRTFVVILAAAGQVLGKPEPENFETDCGLNGQSLYGWMVRIWSTATQATVAHGSIISHLAVVSGCSTMGEHYHNDKPDDIEIIGQTCKDMRHWNELTNWCTQKRGVKRILRHPKCLDDQIIPQNKGAGWTVRNIKHAFDFAIFVLKEPFHAFSVLHETGQFPTYPTITLPVTPRRFLMEMQFLKVQTDPICELPTYKERQERVPTFLCGPDENSKARPLPLDSLCIESMCNDDVFASEEGCETFFKTRANGTALCMVTSGWASKVPFHKRKPEPPDDLFWQNGAPFACNGTSYGHAGVFSLNGHFLFANEDFFYIVTYLRVWPWLQGAIARFGATEWVKQVDLEALTLETIKVPTPSAVPITDQILPFRIPIKTVNVKLPSEIDEPWVRSDGCLMSLPRVTFTTLFAVVGVTLT